MGYSATNKTKIKNTFLLLDKKPYFNSGKIHGKGGYYSFLGYSFTLPNFIKNVDILSFTFNLIDTYADDWLYVHINNHRYYLGGGWILCSDYDNIYCSPVKTTSLNISQSALNFDSSNSLVFFLLNVDESSQAWLVLKEFQLSFTYITK